MVIIWAVVIAATLLVEFVSTEFVSLWFSVGAIVALILAACGAKLDTQVIVFVLSAGALLACFRPIAKKLARTTTVATNAEAEIGRKVKLLSDVVDGKATANFSGTYWTLHCEDALKKGDMVKITAIEGNKYTVKKADA